MADEEVKIEPFNCGRCGQVVQTKWAYQGARCLGLLSDPNYAIVADVPFHAPCWDQLTEEFPV